MSLLSQISAAVGGNPTGPTGPAYVPVAAIDNATESTTPPAAPADSTTTTTITPAPLNPRQVAKHLQQRKFLLHFARSLDFRDAAQKTGIPLSTFDRWYREPEFITAYAAARHGLVELWVDDIELRALRSAANGNEAMIKFILQAHKPDIYKRREVKIEQNNINNGEQKIYIGDFSGNREELINKIRERNAEIQRKKLEVLEAEVKHQGQRGDVIEAETTKTEK